MIKTKKIKDNIQGYVYYSRFEEIFLSHRLVLRLHQIRQNGAAFLTYPSIRVHRYEHSLGAMHIAGQLLLNSVRFSPDSRILAHVAETVAGICGQSIPSIRTALTKSSIANNLSFITQDGVYHQNSLTAIDDDHSLALLLLYQATRIAMLVHDIGHPPFSHTFEVGLKQLGVNYDDHERVGLDLLDLIIEDIERTQSNDRYVFATHISSLVRSIIDKKSQHHDTVAGVAAIVSGDIDADRLDYVRRDATSGGLSTNSYDIGRLFDAVKLVGVDGSGSDATSKRGLRIEYHAEALSTLEAFFGMRFHLYRWMLWHHSVIMQNMVLVSITHDIYQASRFGSGKIHSTCQEIIDIALNKSRRIDYWFFTDAYLLDKLALIFREMEAEPEIAAANKDFYINLRTFLFREKLFIKPFWKRPDDYARFGSYVIGGAKNPPADLNAKLRSKFERIRENTRELIRNGQLANEADNDDYHSRAFSKALEAQINRLICDKKCCVRAYYLSKFKATPSAMRLKSGSDLIDLGILSPSIPALETAWQGLPHLWLFLDVCEAVKAGENHGKRYPEPVCSDKSVAHVLESVASATARFLEADEPK